MVSPAGQGQVPHPLIVPEFLRSTSCGMTSARGQGAIVYCLNSGSEERQTDRHNKKEDRRKEKKEQEKGQESPGERTDGRRRKDGKEREETEKRERRRKETERESERERVMPALNGEKG
ncbi:hypothetical protein TNCV_2366801 [Trichonephila clavipes]|nr:hypothetical protein TNCV_2366801 [Trichonephila clavipes]